MSGTAVVAEILIVGLEAEAWLALLVVTIFGSGWVDLGACSSILLVLVLAAAYVLGVVVDRGADEGFKWFSDTRLGHWSNRTFGKGSETWLLPAREQTMRTAVMAHGGGTATFIDYQRSRLRVARGTAVNLLAAIAVSAVYFPWREGWASTLRIEAPLLVLLACVLPAAERIRTAWLGRLQDAFRALGSAEGPPQSEEGAVVAAVAFTRTDEGPRFVLVRTKAAGRGPSRRAMSRAARASAPPPSASCGRRPASSARLTSSRSRRTGTRPRAGGRRATRSSMRSWSSCRRPSRRRAARRSASRGGSPPPRPPRASPRAGTRGSPTSTAACSTKPCSGSGRAPPTGPRTTGL